MKEMSQPGLTNETFLRSCFGAGCKDAHVTGFTPDPGHLERFWMRQAWMGDKWSRLSPRVRAELPHQNSYFTISLFDDDPKDGRARRQKALFRACHVIVVDDVGTKVRDRAKLPPPSWVLETSPGNFQWGYILAAPETDQGRVNAVLDGMVAAGLCPDGKDPGMRGVTRYVRLPQGRNTKAKYGAGGFRCLLRAWHPERRFTIDQLAAPWGIVLPAPGTAVVRFRQGPADAKDALLDPIFAQLHRWGMIDNTRTADGSGFMCECPWLADHTGRDDTGTAYWLGGGFTCFHGHCVGNGRPELIAWVNAKLLAEQGISLAGLDFRDADKPLVDKHLWNVLVAGGLPSSQDIVVLSRVPGRDVEMCLRAARAILGTDTRSIRQRLDRARARDNRTAFRAAATPAKSPAPVPLPQGGPQAVSLAEVQASVEQALATAFSPEVIAAGGAATVLLRTARKPAA